MLNKEIAKALLEIEAVSLQPNDMFTWSSGIKSPIYCDNRLTMSYPEVRDQIADGLKSLIETHFSNAEVLAGTATAGIPHAAFTSQKMNLPMSYVRSSSKKHGKGNQIEGRVLEGQKVVVVEDLISTGGSAIEAADALKAHGADVLGIVAIFTYGLNKGKERLENAGYKYYTLSDFDSLVEVASETGKIEASDIEGLINWRDNL
ncbi:orotate phosphoribosyltransferase [Macrococcus armenti]|uniref:orotate phosphoribosyltransferase n=1 Tax=Macrococcus armenti TaxID=2875764 RepID=UPI001CCC0A03|nr:orotate phosphoribosyltransferase [Macrococcus armenti]UBH09471.1 orotate phosphoribosyltransferase [Macrococcus armenti]UBH11763.1 orotate phosphoribosyltransferase [Macrococcus armenti]UBH16236.1 orotate phosphoribosyltransferase [Macrococcus armenti]UBH18595.1 orotate phosphoribosyltransferase [Macrococcus armenti]UBH20864.1 orotate phosphoribosyltransferase [Macrococcus armenti]